MSSIMRARSGLTGRAERLEGIGGSSLEPKVAGPSMLGIGCPDRHPLPFNLSTPLPKTCGPRCAESRESGFVPCPKADPADCLRNFAEGWNTAIPFYIRRLASSRDPLGIAQLA